jgi:CRP/FNR family cyclic AMP-dependent transcriptional regulator
MSAGDELRRFTLFERLAAPELDALALLLRRRTFPTGTLLFRKGDPGETMLLIYGGEVRIFMHDEGGNEITFRRLGAGQIVGEFALLDGKPRSASAIVTASLETLILERDDFLRLIQQRPLVGVQLMRGLAERIRYATSYLERLYDVLELLTNREYDAAIRELAINANEDEMQQLIAAFLTLARRAQATDTPTPSAPDEYKKKPLA